MKCKDCGKTDYVIGDGRADICPDCLDLRLMIVKMMPMTDKATFAALQRTIANSNGSGRGAAAMREFLGLDQPEI